MRLLRQLLRRPWRWICKQWVRSQAVRTALMLGFLLLLASPRIILGTSVGVEWAWRQIHQLISADVTITLTPNWGGPGAPTDFDAEYINDHLVTITWTNDPGATGIMIRAKYGEYPADRTDGYQAYYGAAATVDDNSVSLDETATNIYYRAWSENGVGWSAGYAEDNVGGIGMVLIALVLLAAGLTVAMFMSKSSMLGFPCVIFWAVLGGYAYAESAGAWTDWQFFLAMGCLLGMVPFSALAAFGLRTKKEDLADGDEFIDEGKDDLKFIDELGGRRMESRPDGGNHNSHPEEVPFDQPSAKVQALRDRAARRRLVGAKRRTNYGEFR